MPDVIQPLVTNPGFNAAMAQSGMGLQLEITHVQVGTGAYTLDPAEGSADYNRASLVAPTETVAIAAGHVMARGFRVDAMFPAWVGAAYGVTEIGFWAGDPAAGGVLFAIWAQNTAFIQRNNIDYLASFALGLARVPDGSVTITFDPDLQKAIALVTYHEEAADPHPQYVKKAGDTMDGPLTLPGAPTQPLHAAPRNYVDALVPAGAVLPFAMSGAPAGWLRCDGAAVSRATYAALFAALVKSATVALTIGSPGTVTWNAHGRSANDPVTFSTTGALPTGLVAGTTYYVVGAGMTANTFRVAAAPGGAAINFSGGQSGVHTATHAPWGVGDGATTFNVPKLYGEFVRGWDAEGTVDADRAFGSSQADMLKSHQHGYTQPFGGGGASQASSGGVSGPTTLQTGATGGAETRPRNVALLYCIKC